MEIQSKLKEAGLIDFITGRKREPTRYRLNSFANCHFNELQLKDSLDISSVSNFIYILFSISSSIWSMNCS